MENAIIKGQHEADLAKVRTYHGTGRLIREHVLRFKDRADFGARTIQRLAVDLHIDRSVLHRCVRFVECFPIVATWPQLTWAHFRTLGTTKPDKYDRYLADIFLTLADGWEVFLNQALLDNGHAERKTRWEFSDWDK